MWEHGFEAPFKQMLFREESKEGGGLLGRISTTNYLIQLSSLLWVCGDTVTECRQIAFISPKKYKILYRNVINFQKSIWEGPRQYYWSLCPKIRLGGGPTRATHSLYFQRICISPKYMLNALKNLESLAWNNLDTAFFFSFSGFWLF